MASNSSGKPPRVLACVLCQNRKIKCDRRTPCSNCIKANVSCTPSTPAPARKRRRPNQDLQQRLARCEELLSEYATAKPPAPSSIESPTQDESWKPLGKLIVDDGGVKFIDSFLWATIHSELSAMREILEDEETVDDPCTPAESQISDLDAGLILSDTSNTDLEELHPQPAHVFRLWQIFIERVNPITKVIHVPTVQPLLVEAAASRAKIPKNAEALLFSIYLMATVALTEDECLERFGYTKDVAYTRFSKGCRSALMRIGILKNYDLVVLQALVLYLFSLPGHYDRHAAWILNGVTVRIAQKMGLHRDGEFLGLSPFETEMRRRIWWQIILLDAMYALMSGLGHSLLPRSWDTKPPLNLNDSDLYPTMTALQPKDSPTDMIFRLVCCELAATMVDTPELHTVIMQNEMGVDNPEPEKVERASRRIDELDRTLTEILTKYSDPLMGPVHVLATETKSIMIDKLRELVCPLRSQPEWGTEILTPKDNLFKLSLTAGEQNLRMYQIPQTGGFFLWFMMSHFQIEVFIYMVGQLSTRTSGQLVERAWQVVEMFYQWHTELYDLSMKAHMASAIFTIRAWNVRERILRDTTGSAPETPGYIIRLLSLLPPDEARHTRTGEMSTATSLNVSPAAPTQQPNTEVSWDQMLGFVDANSIDWGDMFSVPAGGQPQPNFGGYATVFGGNSINWM
ncbi:fungal-specific transcription factor domain-containing protein [Daldinia vernicosa]|uniref:fungal-specific transcription factor domain-containing protein n=1 Tax=Daldinia vernicosa TaxID=114800 RepID=UPI002007DBAD|nr:fungal-specific transcription factor domain-containing protein [Daldinia vernicosa]KAI0852163.1 fungal-specific transcription factor domain-containing protein [Daldinia vernicosa]